MPLNVPHIQQIIAAIKREAETERGIGFNMGTYIGGQHPLRPDQSGGSCGTVACIAGWSHVLGLNITAETSTMKRYWNGVAAVEAAAQRIGLPMSEAQALFHPHVVSSRLGIQWEDITADMAIAVLNNLIATGKVDWKAAVECVRNAEQEPA